MKKQSKRTTESNESTPQKMVHRRLFTDIVMLLVLVVGVLALLYPFVSDAVNDLVDQQLIAHYQKQANQENEAALAKIEAEQEKKNQEIAKNGTNPGADPFDAKKKKSTVKPTKSYFQKHTIGIIQIPKINLKLPIFDQTTDLFLSKGATHLEGTSYPIGGPNTHSVISAHRGLPKAKLFTDLPKLKKGNHFYLEVNHETHAYEVDQIKVIEPTETQDMQIVAGQDLVTLMTCTPYMINSHRLLVRGHRIPYEPEMKKELQQANQNRLIRQVLIGLAALLSLLLLIWLIRCWLRNVLIRRRRYELKFRLEDSEQQAINGQSFKLFTSNGKRPVQRNGKQLTVSTDEQGIGLLPDLRGGNYLLEQEAKQPLKFQLRVAKIKDSNFKLKPSRGILVEKVETAHKYPTFRVKG